MIAFLRENVCDKAKLYLNTASRRRNHFCEKDFIGIKKLKLMTLLVS